MDGHPNPYPPPYTPYEYPPPNQPPTGPYLAQPASFPSHPHNLAPQFNHSGPLLYRPPTYSPTTYDNPYPPSPPAYPNLNPSHHDPNLYQHPEYSSFHHIRSGQYDRPNMQPELNQNPSGFQHAGSDRYEMSNHSSSSHHSYSDSISMVHDGGHNLDSRPSLKVLLLHGSLEIIVRNARNLPNKDMFHEIIGDRKMGDPMTSDPYVAVSVSDVVIACTYVKYDNENPEWDQNFYVPVAHETSVVLFTVKDEDTFGAQIIGTVSIPAETIYSEERIDEVFPLLGPNGMPCNQGATLSLLIQYIPVARLRMYPAGPDCKGVANTYFPLRRGGKVTLYQDAHVPENCLPKFWLENGVQFQHGQCWRDMFDAISGATKFIYIAGWSVLHTVTLVRDGGMGNMVMLGDLLKRKSQEGVRVCLLIWDDRTSRNILGHKFHGFMHTNDEQTRQFFKHSSVNVLLCPRTTGKKNRFVRQQEAKTIFTHHQKTLVLDANAGNYRRKIIAFVGGLDLCGGRYDTPAHHLFRTLDTIHKDDFHNPNFKKVDNQGPREPWHDLHSKIDSPAAYDVLANFVERWLKALKWHERKIIGKSSDDTLLNLENIPEIYLDDAPYMSDNDPESWDVQVFRSIDSNSAKGFPKDPREASPKKLFCGKNVLIDMSIHTAYVNAIRAAQHFIYIENQYFLGSSFNWDSNKDTGTNNLIPIEIALKIANKIKANQRFAAYIVIPMWPEGNPTGPTTQRILYWQKKTMQMMYETIYRALKEAGLEDKYEPQDYLNFFCLGNRESLDRMTPGENYASSSAQENARKSRRFMIYVHSKGMIVDDEYVIIGSANINQRSLDGTVDTEIAMGAYQPQYTWTRRQSAPHGQIYGYRMSLWAEHTGTTEEIFNQPQSLECVQRVRTMGELNWKQYVADEVTEMRGHLLKYPLKVDKMGKVTPLPDSEIFPDLGGEIGGSPLPLSGCKNLEYLFAEMGSIFGVHETLTK